MKGCWIFFSFSQAFALIFNKLFFFAFKVTAEKLISHNICFETICWQSSKNLVSLRLAYLTFFMPELSWIAAKFSWERSVCNASACRSFLGFWKSNKKKGLSRTCLFSRDWITKTKLPSSFFLQLVDHKNTKYISFNSWQFTNFQKHFVPDMAKKSTW